MTGRSSILIILLCILAGHSSTLAFQPSFSSIPPSRSTLYAGFPDSLTDRSVAAFSDLGAWHGFALPPADRTDLIGGFVGPLLFDENAWFSRMLVQLHLTIDDQLVDLRTSERRRYEAEPGILRESFRAGGLEVELALFYDHSTRTLIRAKMMNAGEKEVSVNVGWAGSVAMSEPELLSLRSGVRTTTRGGYQVVVAARDVTPYVEGRAYTLREQHARKLAPSASHATFVSITLGPDAAKGHVDADGAYRANRERWSGYLQAIDAGFGDGHPQKILVEKSLMTLISNWRSPRGGLTRNGLFPSSAVWYFNGFWAWDSWKHAAAIARFDTELAKDQVRAMFDHQNDVGMIPDVVYTDPSEDNWRDTKPPLSGWAVQEIFERDGDLGFVLEIYPKIVRYHRWWYRDRDHDGDGLCEYGSTDGTIIAARWESGMDNAVRFDMTGMLQNGDSAWSMNQESVDLNAYLYREKLALADLAGSMGREAEAVAWRSEAGSLGEKIRTEMYDPERGWFSDFSLDGSERIDAQGPEGWIPLWAGVASPEQADRVRETMLDTAKFYTPVPFPTVSRNDPEFSEGYWRGLVWIDQAWFAIEGLRRYGFEDDARSAAKRLITHLEGATIPGFPLFENYNAITGEGRNVAHFSWTAAHILMLGLDFPLE